MPGNSLLWLMTRMGWMVELNFIFLSKIFIVIAKQECAKKNKIAFVSLPSLLTFLNHA